MPPAWRITDMHTCPIHVGGLVAAPCCPTVLTGDLAAARVTDQALCPGGPDDLTHHTILSGIAANT